MLAAQGIDVITSTITLYNEIHLWKEKYLPDCCTIFLDVPIEELRRRDPKQIYKRYFNNELINVAGLDLAVDTPAKPTIHIKWWSGMDLERTWAEIREQVNMYFANNVRKIN